MKYRYIEVKKAGGGYRKQKAMVLASGKLKFVKNSTKSSGATKHHKKKHHKKGKHVASKAMTKHRKSHRKSHRKGRRSHRRSAGVNMLHLALAGAGIGYAANNVQSVKDLAAKIPGAKTFGGGAMGAATTLGLVAAGVHHFVKPAGIAGKIAKYGGMLGIALAAYQVGSQGSNFKWVGDVGDDDMGAYDLEDVGDDDLSDEDLGDDDLSDEDLSDE